MEKGARSDDYVVVVEANAMDVEAAKPLISEAYRDRGEASTAASKGLGSRLNLQLAITVLWCIAWTCMSPATVIINTHLMVDAGFKYPTFVAFMGLVSTTLLSYITMLATVPKHRRQTMTHTYYTSRVLPTGLIMAMTFGMGNAAYLYLSFSFVQMLKSLTPVITMVLAFAAKLEKPTKQLVMSVSLISLGVILASIGEINMNLLGFFLMVTSIFGECLRVVLMQTVLVGFKMDPFEGLYWIGTACTSSLFILFVVFELRHFIEARAWELAVRHPKKFVAPALAAFAVNALAIVVIKRASSLTLKVLGTVKDIGLVMFGMIFRGNLVTPLQLHGYAISLVGFGAYNVIKGTAVGKKDHSK